MWTITRWTSVLLGILCMLGHTSPATAGEVRVPLGPYGAGVALRFPVKSIKECREDGITLQRLDYSCGSAALATIFTSYLQQPYSEAEIIDFIVRNGDLEKIAVRRGFSLLDLKRFADAHGVTATGYELDFPSLIEFGCPVLVPLYRKEAKMRHFVIFCGATEERVFLADPALGRQAVPRAIFEAQWQPPVGMVFSYPGVLPTAHTRLGAVARETNYLSDAALRTVVRQSALQFIHKPNEF